MFGSVEKRTEVQADQLALPFKIDHFHNSAPHQIEQDHILEDYFKQKCVSHTVDRLKETETQHMPEQDQETRNDS